MAITDINISEELETNAPSIKYSGNEGPKSPQEMQEMMMMSSVDEPFYRSGDEDEHSFRMFNKPYKELSPMELDEFWEEMERLRNKFTGPVLSSPEDPVNPFGPKPIGPVLPDRQMAAYGGIMGVDGRRQYGLGSKFKKFFRKVVPNELSSIAVKAAPFIAPFNPLAAGLMSGIGGFDRTGRIGSSLKSGLMNYGMGNLARVIGGAGFQGGLKSQAMAGQKGLGSYFTSPTSGARLFGETVKQSVPIKSSDGTYTPSTFNENFSLSGETGQTFGKAKDLYSVSGDLDAQAALTDKALKNVKLASQDSPLAKLGSKIMEYVPTSLGELNPLGENFDIKKLVGTFGIFKTAEALLGDPNKVTNQIMDRGDGMDVTAIRAEVQEAFQDETGAKLKALRVKYPYLGRADTKDMTAMAADGGRIGFKIGGGAGVKLAELLAGKKITGSSRTFLEKIFGKERFKEMATRDPDMHRGMLEVVEMFRNRDKEGLKMYLQKFLPHMDDATIEDFIIGGGGTEGIQGQLIRLGSGRDYAGKLEMMKSADNVRKLSELDIKNMKPNAYGGRIRKAEGGLMDLGGMEKDYRAEGGFVPIGREEKADDVPARLSVNEFVFTADAVRNAGGGDIDKGAEVMENMMKHLEQGGQVSDESQGMAGAQQMFETSERLSEVI